MTGHHGNTIVYTQQRMPTVVRVSTDTDHAGGRFSRKSTTGVGIRLGKHCIRAASNLQASVGLSVGEAEFYALVDGGARDLGFPSC